ncbi:hypothetical protein DVR12_11795 [Chitinophaga silvatica]|uniref:Uncharacterized protein n=1 Tax=Chitinophaga silvatica TaxID=2282649 RepID=A0A3E1Y9V8_9BACT|nr:hypothetical protein [Chitinophaga silvatica]RFS22480.1 hypothetical protein DVR12_11795 [Chitinophaga silvatica]
MEEFEQRWKEVEKMLAERFGKTPNMEAILFLIGLNELNSLTKKKYTKEQKQDLMHIAVCSLLSRSGYFELEGLDKDGWPHFKEIHPVPKLGMEEQEHFLKEHIIDYFTDHEV